MKKYILDTDIISYLWDSKSKYHSKIVEKLNTLADSDIVGITIVTIYELTYGLHSFKDAKLKNTFKNALDFLQNDQDINIYTLDVYGAEFFSQLKLKYKKDTGIKTKEIKKNDLDMIIASIAIKNNAVLVSNDKLFAKLAQLEPKFKYENWLE